MWRLILFVAAALFAVSYGNAPASAQSYPQRAVRFILPFGPGAGVDITARMLAERLAARWGKPVVVENRPGGDGIGCGGLAGVWQKPLERASAGLLPGSYPTCCPSSGAVEKRRLCLTPLPSSRASP
jgi:tripartite-type tricarboxylate transporter receptor subunit TctC